MRAFFILLMLTTSQFNLAATVYKYQDQQGRWHFTDQKPAQQSQSLHFKSSQNSQEQIKTWLEGEGAGYKIMAYNPFYAPINLQIELPGQKLIKEIPARASLRLAHLDEKRRFNYRYVLGSSKASPTTDLYQLPIKPTVETYISQSFAGGFSHQGQANHYAVDIAMPVGTEVFAARAGIVAEVVDHFVLSDTDQYFANKANRVVILHEDGTLAVYAHLLADSRQVEPGQRVNVGDLLARSGSTGYSSGPHLHFVIWQNKGMAEASLPFRFYFAESGKAFVPNQGLQLKP